MKCPTCSNCSTTDTDFCSNCGSFQNLAGDLKPIIDKYIIEYSNKMSKNIFSGDKITNQIFEKHKNKYLKLSANEQVLVLLGDSSWFSLGAFTGLAITNKKIHYRTLKNSIFTSQVPWWLKGPTGSKTIYGLESIEIAQLDSCIGTSYVGHELRINGEILGYVRMGTGIMYDENAKMFLNGLFNHLVYNKVLKKEVSSYWWS